MPTKAKKSVISGRCILLRSASRTPSGNGTEEMTIRSFQLRRPSCCSRVRASAACGTSSNSPNTVVFTIARLPFVYGLSDRLFADDHRHVRRAVPLDLLGLEPILVLPERD